MLPVRNSVCIKDNLLRCCASCRLNVNALDSIVFIVFVVFPYVKVVVLVVVMVICVV
jgi:hypothetical protein